MKKIFYKFSAYLVMTTMLFGASLSLRAADIPITIHINASPWYGGFEGLVLQYEKDTGNKVILDKIPYPGMLEKARNAFAADESPYDLVNLDNGWVAELYDAGFLTPLTDIDPSYTLDPDYSTNADAICWDFERKWATCETGKIMAFSSNGQTHLWYYRNDLIDKAPVTWDDVMDNCRKLHNPPKLYGAVQRGERGNPIRFAFSPHMFSFGGSIFADPSNGDYTVTFNSPQVAAAAESFITMLQTCSTGTPAVVGQGEMVQLMLTGKAAQAGIVVAAQAHMDNPAKSAVVGKISYTIMPRPADGKHNPVFGSWQMGIPANLSDERKQAAMEFVKYYQTSAAQNALAETGGIPTSYSVLGGPLSNEERYRWMSHFGDSAAAASSTLIYVEGKQVEDVIGLYMNEILLGTYTVNQGLNLAAKDLHAIVERTGRNTGMLDPLPE